MRPAAVLQSVAMLGVLAACDARRAKDRPAIESDAIRARPTEARGVDSTMFTAPPSQSGDLALVANGLTFTPCGDASSPTPVKDLPAGEARALIGEMGGAARRVAVMVRLEAGRILEIRHAAPEGRGCEAFPPEGDVEARGNEPFWVVRVNGDTARVLTPETPAGTAYHRGTWARSGDSAWVYQARTAEGPPHSLTLRLTAVRCVDNMSGAWFPFRAVLSRGDNQEAGCALEGRQARTAAAEQQVLNERRSEP